MSITIDKILAAVPATTRGQPTQLSCDAKGERIAYAVSTETLCIWGQTMPLLAAEGPMDSGD